MSTEMKCEEYRSSLDPACENLALTLKELGFTRQGLKDSELIEVAARKMKTMHSMLLAAGLSRGILDAVIAE